MKEKDRTKEFFIISMTLLIIDQIIKQIIRTKQPIIDLKILTIEYVKNTGASFGILQNNNLMFIWISIIVIGTILLSYEKLNKKTIPPIIILTGGILSNLIDRVIQGGVTDYINLGWWPVFNIADAMIVISIITLIIRIEEKEIKEKIKTIKNKIKKMSKNNIINL